MPPPHKKTCNDWKNSPKILFWQIWKSLNHWGFFPTCAILVDLINSAKRWEADASESAAVKNFPISTKETEVKLELGVFSYYHRHVENFAEIAGPLHKVNEEAIGFDKIHASQYAIEILQSIITTTAFLAEWCRNFLFCTQTLAYRSWEQQRHRCQMDTSAPSVTPQNLSARPGNDAPQ